MLRRIHRRAGGGRALIAAGMRTRGGGLLIELSGRLSPAPLGGTRSHSGVRPYPYCGGWSWQCGGAACLPHGGRFRGRVRRGLAGLGKGLGGLRRAAVGKRRGRAVGILLSRPSRLKVGSPPGEIWDGQGAQRRENEAGCVLSPDREPRGCLAAP